MIILKRSSNNQYYFIVKAKNGRVLLTSETYKRKQNAHEGIAALKQVVKTKPWPKDETGKPDKAKATKKKK